MSENQAVAADGVSAGALLKQAREAAGLHVATIAAVLKVPVRMLEALEEDRYDELPDAVFARGLAASMCRTLKIDPAPVLQRLPQTPQPSLASPGRIINEPFRSPSDGPAPGLLNQVSRPVVLTVVALLLAALVLVFLPFVQRGVESVSQATRGEQEAAPAPAPVPAEPNADVRPEQPTTAPAPAASGVAGLPAAPASAAGAVPTPAAVTQAPEAAAPATTSASAPAAAAASGPIDAKGIVVFRARAQSWVQVKDARGATVMQKLLGPGESAGASGALPLAVVVGSARDTEVQVRGQAFDLARATRDNVARFEVK
jgi:cytoskeleton protein RodZ